MKDYCQSEEEPAKRGVPYVVLLICCGLIALVILFAAAKAHGSTPAVYGNEPPTTVLRPIPNNCPPGYTPKPGDTCVPYVALPPPIQAPTTPTPATSVPTDIGEPVTVVPPSSVPVETLDPCRYKVCEPPVAVSEPSTATREPESAPEASTVPTAARREQLPATS